MTTESTEAQRLRIFSESGADSGKYQPATLSQKKDPLTEQIIGAAVEVHRYWGPGLYEEIYERSLARELTLRAIPFQRQVSLPLVYKDEHIGDHLVLDLFVNQKVVVETKTINQFSPVHEAQLLTYMRLTNCKVGLLINFNVPVLVHGVKRMVL